MTRKNQTSQILAWESLPSKESSRKIAGRKEGLDLPNSVTEDIGGFSLMPYYSAKQLRRINGKLKHKNRYLSRSAKKEWRMASRW